MAEGFYRARDNEDLPESLLSSIQAVCTILPIGNFIIVFVQQRQKQMSGLVSSWDHRERISIDGA